MIDDRGISATDMAIKYGRWEIFDKILYLKIGNGGNKMREKADFEKNKISKQYGIVETFLNQFNENSNYKDGTQCVEFLLSIVIVIELIKQRHPISEDILLLLWKWELGTQTQYSSNPLKTQL